MTSVFVLGHAELGDNITCIGAINYLLTIYKNVYFVCQYNNLKNLKILYSNPRIFLVPFKIENKLLAWYNLLYPRYKEKNMDILISGPQPKTYFKSKITNKILKYRIKNNAHTIENKYIQLQHFYTDINLDLSIYYNYFNINSSIISQDLFNKIKKYNIIFMHSTSSNKKIDLTTFINKHINNDNDIIISADINAYAKNNAKYDLAQRYVNLLVPHYIDIIKNAQYIYIVNSCFSCIVIPLAYNKKIKAIEYKIFDRNASI
jgi:hypothetical protein